MPEVVYISLLNLGFTHVGIGCVAALGYLAMVGAIGSGRARW